VHNKGALAAWGKKLAADGTSSKGIAPFGERAFLRAVTAERRRSFGSCPKVGRIPKRH